MLILDKMRYPSSNYHHVWLSFLLAALIFQPLFSPLPYEPAKVGVLTMRTDNNAFFHVRRMDTLTPIIFFSAFSHTALLLLTQTNGLGIELQQKYLILML